MAANTNCKDPTDATAQLFYSRGNYIIFQTGPFPIAFMAQYMHQIEAIGSVVWVETYGPNGTSTYEGPYWDGYGKQFGYPPTPPIGKVDLNGVITCGPPVVVAPGPPAPPTPTPPPAPPDCPPGFTWDPTSGTCIAVISGGGGGVGGGGIPPVFPSPPPIPPAPPPPPQGGDEGAECCAMTAGYFYSIAQQLQYLAELMRIADQSTCCATVAATIGSITLQLQKLTDAVTAIGANADPVTCAQLTGLFEALSKAITDGDAAIADAIAKGSGSTADPNVKRIADAVNGFPSDAPGGESAYNTLVQKMVDELGFPADLAQLVTT